MARCQRTKVCRRPQRKNHVVRRIRVESQILSRRRVKRQSNPDLEFTDQLKKVNRKPFALHSNFADTQPRVKTEIKSAILDGRVIAEKQQVVTMEREESNCVVNLQIELAIGITNVASEARPFVGAGCTWADGGERITDVPDADGFE